jgi:ankyrin repeat protein
MPTLVRYLVLALVLMLALVAIRCGPTGDLTATIGNETSTPAPGIQNLLTASRRGDVNAVRKALSDGVDVNATDPIHGRTALMRAAAFNHASVVEALLAAKANIATVDSDTDSVLHIAAAANAPDVAPLLIRAGADVNAQRKRDGWTPLAAAADAEAVGIVRALLEARADPNRRGAGEPAPLELAIRAGNPTIVAALMASQASLTVSSDVMPTTASLLHMAIDNVQEGDPEIVRLLLAARADATSRDHNGRTPYARAALMASAGYAKHGAALRDVFHAAGVTR